MEYKIERMKTMAGQFILNIMPICVSIPASPEILPYIKKPIVNVLPVNG